MSTMYEKLADLLNKTLKDGTVKFINVPSQNKNAQKKSADKNENFSNNQKNNQKVQSKKNQNLNDEILYNQSENKQNQSSKNQNESSSSKLEKKESKLNQKNQPNFNNFTKKNLTQEERKKILFENQFLSLSDKEKFALKVLSLELPFDSESLKQAYKEKLKYYHPDHWNKNDVLRNIAHKKTQEIINANQILFEYLKRHNFLSKDES